MSKERFVQLCREVQVDDEWIEHIWECHRPPEDVTEAEVRETVPQIVFVHETLRRMVGDGAAA